MLSDKHIIQWLEYLLEDLPNCEDLLKDKGLEKVFLDMYKKGWNDCRYDHQLDFE